MEGDEKINTRAGRGRFKWINFLPALHMQASHKLSFPIKYYWLSGLRGCKWKWLLIVHAPSCCVSLHKWCHGFFGVPSPLLDLFLIPLMPLWSRSIWLLTPYSSATRAVIPNEQLSNAVRDKKHQITNEKIGKWKKRQWKSMEDKGKAVDRYRF